MPSRRDQMQSYQFAVQRAVSALVAREADPAQSPLRRLVGAGFGSVMIAVVALAAVGIFGLVTGRSSAGWRDGGKVILERETGAAYVLRDGRLIPMANFASALLLQRSAGTVTVPRAQLAGVPRAPMVGIPNAPDALPDPKRLLTDGWTLCSALATTPTGATSASTALFVGAPAPGGKPLGDNEAVLVRLPDGDTTYLVWHNYRYRISQSSVVLTGMNMRQEPVLPVGAAWLNALPQGQVIAPLAVSDRGEPFDEPLPELPDVRVGQVLVVETGGGRQHYLVGANQLRLITQVEADIAMADPRINEAYPNRTPEIRPLSASAANSVPRSSGGAPGPDRAPEVPPKIARLSRPDAAVCTTYVHGDALARVSVDATPSADGGVPTGQRTERGVPLADRVLVETGRGAVVEAMPTPDAPGGTLFLVTDLGVRYPVPSPDVLRMLGYGAAQPVRLPAGLVARMPEGPALDPLAAARPVEPVD